MKRRAFIKSSLALAGTLAATGMGPAKAARAAGKAGAGEVPGPRIDSYCHFSSMGLIDFLEQESGRKPHVFRALFANTPALIDPGERIRLMDETGVDVSVLVPLPWLETAPPVHADAKKCAAGARLFNDGLAGTVAQNSKRFAFVALLPTTTPETMVAELERGVRELGAKGGMFVAGPTVKRADHADYEALYKKAVELDVPLWMHPSRPPVYSDYVDEKVSKFQVWQTLSWLQDSSAAMVRMVFAGVFDRHPKLKVIIHHHGALIPLFAQRMQYGWDYFEQNTGQKQPTQISAPYIEHFRKFYCDTATQGHEPLLLQIAASFFGPERVLFGSDAPMDATSGRAFTNDAIKSVEDMDIPVADKQKIFSGNARRLLKLG